MKQQDKLEFIKWINGLLSNYSSPLFRSVMIAQAILESNWGRSYKATYGNNFTGHKSGNEWSGETFVDKSFEFDKNGKRYETNTDEWRKYESPDRWAEHHSKWLTRTAFHEKYYKKVIESKTLREQCNALQGTYATDIHYAESLMEVINECNLQQYDIAQQAIAKENEPMNKPKIIDRRTKALGYPNHGVYPKRSLSQIKYIVWHYTATTHKGYGMDVISAHERYWANHHGWNLGGYHYYIDRAGNIFQNYDLSIVTYGAGNVNPQAMHISLEASHKNNYTPAQLKAREQLTLWLLKDVLKHLSGNSVKGHKEFMQTACPGYSIAELNAFRKDISAKLDKDWGNVTPQPIKPVKGGKYTVKHGDNLWAIAKAHNVTVGQLREWNGIQNGEWLKTGQEIIVSEKKVDMYTVKKGDSLWAIGQMFGVTVDELIQWNALKTKVLQVGQMLRLTKPEVKDVPKESPEKVEVVEEKPTDKKDDAKEKAIEFGPDEELRVSNDGKIKIVKVK